MEPINFPIERINNFLKVHNFTIVSPYYEEEVINYKIKLTGTRKLIVVGDWQDVIEYTLYLESAGRVSSKVLNSIFEAIGGNEKTLTTTDTTLFQVTSRVSNSLYNLLNFFNIENHIFCNKVVNDLKNEINESFITEGRYDNIVRKVVKDIMSVVKYQKEGEYVLPEDIRIEDQTYKFSNLPEFTIELEVLESDTVDRFDVECAYYKEEDVITIDIVINPDVKYSILYDIVGELNEQVRHEIEHMVQNVRGIELPEKEPKSPVKYYTQSHEIGAQIAGFKRKAKITKQPYEKVVRNWFEDNKHKHRMTPKQADKVIQQIIQNS